MKRGRFVSQAFALLCKADCQNPSVNSVNTEKPWLFTTFYLFKDSNLAKFASAFSTDSYGEKPTDEEKLNQKLNTFNEKDYHSHGDADGLRVQRIGANGGEYAHGRFRHRKRLLHADGEVGR